MPIHTISLEALYQDMYSLTNNHCGCDYSKQYRCCDKKYCFIAQKFAKEKYGIELMPINDEMPFMGKDGCTVAPYLRPICTLHACCITWAPYKAEFKDDSQRTKSYFSLRTMILEESKRQGKYPWD